MEPFVTTGVLSLDVALSGGLVPQQVNEICGATDTGRRSLALHSLAACHADPCNVAAWLRLSHAKAPFDVEYGRRLGVDPARLLVASSASWDTLLIHFDAITTALGARTKPANLVVFELDAAIPTYLLRDALQRYAAARRRATLLCVTDGACVPIQIASAARIQLELQGRAPNGDRAVEAAVLKNLGRTLPITKHPRSVLLQLTSGDGFDVVKDLIRAASHAGVLEDVDVAALCRRLTIDVAARENLAHTVARRLFLAEHALS